MACPRAWTPALSWNWERMRNDRCPICGSESAEVLQLHFNVKMNLPTEVTLRHCASDNFLFVASGDQNSYDEYYKSLANDSYHSELAGGDLHSPISRLQRDQLAGLLDGFFFQSKKVLDFGCGEGWLLIELASEFPSSIFRGFDPSPGAPIGSLKAQTLGLKNLTISDQKPSDAPYDLIIASHVVEHLLNFDLLHSWNSLLAENGLLYIEVPNSLQYATHERREFLYYFDRIHVNHFTPQSLVRLLAAHGFGYVAHFEYKFPYRDGGEYPALGMLFRKGQEAVGISSPSIHQTAMLYISQERVRAKALTEQLKTFEGVLVWGAGDNFHRSSENGGPLSDLTNIVVLDQRPQVIMIGDRRWITEIPAEGIRRYSWPVLITVSVGRNAICQQMKEMDPSRQVFFL
jgi:2-polyprenyl-3-methyl-5-hydroxy-6-metoxy-1,4-benzoquinol methylase